MYGEKHPAPELLAEAVYGLTELNRTAIKTARLIANPGCYPTGAILGLTPALKEELIQPGNIIIDAKSGVSGAGRTLAQNIHYSEANENISAYSLKGHRHLPEIVQELKAQNPKLSPTVTFVPHLTPMTRGILSTCYARLAENKIKNGDATVEKINKLYRDFYRGEPFVRVVNVPPSTKEVWGSNYCLIYVTIDARTQTLIVITCIDNLVKGASGQAVQNMNLMFGFAETEGIDALPLYP
jgi:N-acetyl-gamma-glutamyl-phosphate reductase